MNGKISLPGLLFGALTALAVGLLASHYSLAWLVLGVAVGMIMGAVLTRPDRGKPTAAPLKLRKGEQQ
jgi:ABC-type dipeptide/oligopeptide/nickel transport system permease subunit